MPSLRSTEIHFRSSVGSCPIAMILALNREELMSRINRRGTITHLGSFDQLCPSDGPDPANKDLKHMEMVSGQLVIARYESIWSQFLSTIP